MMTRLVSWFFFAALGVVAFLLILPSFIDWSRHKDLMVNEISARLGQQVRIDGDVSLSFLPNPHLRLEKAIIGPEGKNRYLAALEYADARMSFSELLHGRFVVDEIVLRNPVINIIDGEIGSNWSVFLDDLRRDAESEEIKKTTVVMLRQVRVDKGRIVYRTSTGAPRWELPDVNMSMGAASLSGPYQMRGDFMYGDQPVTFSLMTAVRSEDGGIPFEMHIEPVEEAGMPEIDVKGKLSSKGDHALTGAVTTSNGGLRSILKPFADSYAALAGISAIDDETATSTFEVALSAKTVTLRDIKANLGKDATLAGDVIFSPGKTDVAADITLTAPTYWLSFKGMADTAQRYVKGDIMLKAESLSAWSPGLPDISGEVMGALTRTSDVAWSISNMTLSLVEWVDVAFKGRVQRQGNETVFTLEDGQTPAVRNISLAGKGFGDRFEATGKAELYGRAMTFSLAGKPEKPEVSVDLQGMPPHFLLDKLKLVAPMLKFTGGNVAFSGSLNITAPNLDEVIVGRLRVNPVRLIVDGFNPPALADMAMSLTALPKNLAGQMLNEAKKDGSDFSARPLDFELPLTTQAWTMKDLTFDSSSFDLHRESDGAVKVIVKPGADSMPGYSGTLPLKENDLPVDQVADIIRQRNPEPKVDSKEAIGGILNRLDSLDQETLEKTEKSDHIDIFKAAPPALDLKMPPQPQPPLPEIEVAPPPPLPADTPLAVDPVGEAPEPLPREIFPPEPAE